LESLLSKCKESIRNSKKQALQFKEERDAFEKQLQSKSADCIVLQVCVIAFVQVFVVVLARDALH
jgi:hypothetical protein